MIKQIIRFFLLFIGMLASLVANENNNILLDNATKYVNGEHTIKNYKKAEKILLPLCEKKVIGSCYLLGTIYSIGGNGLERNITKYSQYRELSCNNSVGFSCFLIAKDLFKKNEDIKVMKYLQKSCNSNYSEGCKVLGLLYEGEGSHKDYKKAIEFYNKGCDLNNSYSCYYQAQAYLKGVSVEKTYERAIEYFSKACKLNNADSCYSLASIYYYGKYTKQNYEKAIELYNKSYELGQTQGLMMIASLYYEGIGVEKNITKAVKTLTIACDDNLTEACKALKKIKRNR